jgi:hypothetical protein
MNLLLNANLTAFAVAHIICPRMVGWLVNIELGRILKETAAT